MRKAIRGGHTRRSYVGLFLNRFWQHGGSHTKRSYTEAIRDISVSYIFLNTVRFHTKVGLPLERVPLQPCLFVSTFWFARERVPLRPSSEFDVLQWFFNAKVAV